MSDWLRNKSPLWLMAAAVFLMALQNEGFLGKISDVFGGGKQTDAQHQEIGRKQDETNKKLDVVIEQLRANGNSQAVGLRVLCMQSAKTDQQRDQCARIQ